MREKSLCDLRRLGVGMHPVNSSPVVYFSHQLPSFTLLLSPPKAASQGMPTAPVMSVEDIAKMVAAEGAALPTPGEQLYCGTSTRMLTILKVMYWKRRCAIFVAHRIL